VSLPANTKELYEAMIAIAEKRMDRGQLAAVFRRATSPD
jgi:hypothetical protein